MKFQLETLYKVSFKEQELWLSGTIRMEDNRTLAFYNITNKTSEGMKIEIREKIIAPKLSLGEVVFGSRLDF